MTYSLFFDIARYMSPFGKPYYGEIEKRVEEKWMGLAEKPRK